MSLSEALAALGLPSFEDMDRLDDEEDDAELDGDFDDLDPPESDFNPNDGPPLPDTMPP
jgi:hypothetical protein